MDDKAQQRPGTPKWVKVSGIVLAVIVVALVVSMLAGVEHGPGMHSGNDGAPAGSETAPAHTPPPGVTHGQ